MSRLSRRADQVPPVMLIGISGATWSVIDAMLAEGELPHLGGLIRAGSSGVLESIKVTDDTHYRPQTAWPSVFSGKRPERHGITEYYHTSRQLRSPCLWDFFGGQGLSAGLYSTPVLWPPPRINGFVIPLMYARDGRAWPEELSTVAGYFRKQQDSKLRPSIWSAARMSARFLPILFGRGRDWKIPVSLARSAARLAIERDPETRSLVLRHAKLDVSTAMFLELRRRYAPRLSVFVSFEVDYISHRYWRYHEPEKFPGREPAPRLRRAVKDAYAHIDRCIGALVKGLPDDRIVAVVSEHGMAAELPSGEIGRWHYVIRAQEVKALASVEGDVVAVPIARWVVFRRRDGGALDASVRRALASIAVVETGLPLFSIHPNGEDEVVIKLDFSDEAYRAIDDIGSLHVSVPREGVVPMVRLLQRAGPPRSAMHRKEGVFVVEGTGIRGGHRIEGAAVTDVMPTLLRAAGLTPPPDLDGAPLDVFA